jgi:hypothetical protein
MSATPIRRIRIDQLNLDLRGTDPQTAEAAARTLGPALAKAMGSPGPAAANDLAATIAQRVARSIRGEAG